MKKVVTPLFDLNAYNTKQIIEILTCPVNRHATRIEHNCDDWELYKHPEWLVEHFVKNGGAEAFAQKRLDFQRLCEDIENCSFGEECELSRLHSGWTHCPVKKKERCMKCQEIQKSES
ncbi:MAG: hypothetical protein WC229_01430 [Candidatus Paceibacterota bacterium]|jgi:hypothetical protein